MAQTFGVKIDVELLRGNPGHQKLWHGPEPTVDPKCSDPPAFITGYAADEWWRIAPELHALGLLIRIDVPSLAAYCHAYGQWRLAAEAWAKMAKNDPVMSGQVIKTKYGDAAANPLVSIARKHAADMVRYAAEFGLSPAARSRIAAGIGPQPPRKFDGLLK